MSKFKFISYTKAKKLFSEVAGSKDFRPISDLVLNKEGKQVLEDSTLVYGYNTDAPDLDIWTITDHYEDFWGDDLPLTSYEWDRVKNLLQEEFKNK